MKKNYGLIISLLLLSSCSSHKIIGSWKFVDAQEGIVNSIGDFKNNVNSKYGSGSLIFNNDSSFISYPSGKDKVRGYFRKEGNSLELKYDDSKDTIKMKISFINRNFLLLSSQGNVNYTWFYKKEIK